MNSTIYRIPSLLLGIACLTGGFTGCESAATQSSRASHFAPTSQDTIVVDTLPGSSGRTGPAAEGSGMPEGIGRIGRRYFYIRNGNATPLYQKQRFAQGYYYDHNHRIIGPDGSFIALGEREMVTFGGGEHITIPPNTTFP